MNPILKLHKDCEGDGEIVLSIARLPTGEKIRLTASGGPLGTIRCCTIDRTVAAFDRKKVRKFLEKSAPELFDK